MNSAPEIAGYRFDQPLLRHALAELWRGRSSTGMDVVALVLSESGAADPAVRERLAQASRVAAMEPGPAETPLWAANLTADRPYAITRLVPGESGAERLIDPLDGLLGNDTASIQAVRAQLTQYGAAPLPPGDTPDHTSAVKTEGKPSASEGKPLWMYGVAVVAVLVVFSIAFSVGAGIGGVVKGDNQAAQSAPPAAVSPSPLPSPILLPGIPKPSGVTYVPPTTRFDGLTGVTYERGADIQVVDDLGLPFMFGFPAPPVVDERAAVESSSIIYRRVLSASTTQTARLDIRIAVRPCADLAGCLAERPGFDQEWTTTYKVPVPATPKDGRTWFTVRRQAPYSLMMTRAFSTGGQWWLVGVAASGKPGEEESVQRIVNDIWRQTQ